MTERRTLFRVLAGLNVVIFLGYVIRVFVAVQTGESPWGGLTLAFLFGFAFVVLGVLLPLAAIGLAAPAALVDLAAAWFFLAVRSQPELILAGLCVVAFAVGATLQGIQVADWLKGRSWSRLDRGKWRRRVAITIGAIAAIAVVAALGVTLLAYWAYSDKVHPEYLEDLRTDPMAIYEDSGLELDFERELEAADTWKGFRAAEIDRRFAVRSSAEPAQARERAIAAAEAAGWQPTEVAVERIARFAKERSYLSIALYEREGVTYLSLTLRSP